MTSASDDRSTERGATLALVAIMAVVLFGAGAIAVDLGNGWTTRRSLITATDAGARAAAQDFIAGGNGCDSGRASEYVLLNNGDAVNIVCEFNPAAQWVTVDADANVETWFAPVLGLGDFDATSSSTVRWGAASSLTGLLPIAMCNESQGIEAWLANPTVSMQVEVPFFNSAGQPESCNGGSTVEGNWGVLDFDGNGGQTPKDMVENGYNGEVVQGDPTLTCTQDPIACYNSEPGNITQLKQALQGRIGDDVFLPIVNYVVDGSGNNVQYHVIGFASVTIDALKLTGPASKRSITITFNSLLTSGTCCTTSTGPSNVNVVVTCAVDRRDLGACSN